MKAIIILSLIVVLTLIRFAVSIKNWAQNVMDNITGNNQRPKYPKMIWRRYQSIDGKYYFKPQGEYPRRA